MAYTAFLHQGDPALAVLADRSRFDMLSKLEENVQRTDVKSKERVYAVAALRLCREGWNDYLTQWNSKLPVEGLQNAENQLATMVKMNQAMRVKLKDAGAICRQVYTTVIGPLPMHLRSGEEIFHELRQDIQRMREDLFINQSGQGTANSSNVDDYLAMTAPKNDTDLQEWTISPGKAGEGEVNSGFSFRDFLELADFKMSHAAKQIFDLETRRHSETSGSAIDWELRLKDVTQDLQKQVKRLSRSLQQEKSKSLATLREQQDEHAGMMMAKGRKFDDMVTVMTEEREKTKNLLEARIVSISGVFDDRLRELSLMFLQKLGEIRDTTEEAKHMAARALQTAIIALKERIRTEADADSALKSIETLNPSRAGDELIDVHHPWDGADNDTLLRLLRGRIQEQEIMTSSQSTFLRARTMEWETALREIVVRYEDELRRLSEKVTQSEELLQVANKATESKASELAEFKWSNAQYREEVKTWTATTAEAHNNRINALNGIIATLDERTKEAKEEAAVANKELGLLRAKQAESMTLLGVEQARRMALEGDKTLKDGQTQTDGSSRKYTMSLDDAGSRQASARRESAGGRRGSAARRDSAGAERDESAGSSRSKTQSSRYLRPSKSVYKLKTDPQEESQHLMPSERSVAGAQSAVNRMSKAFFTESPPVSPKAAPFGRPRDQYKGQQEGEASGAMALSLSARRQSQFASQMQDRRTSMLGPVLSAEEVAAEELAKQHGITIEKLKELLKPSDTDEKTLLAPKGPDPDVTNDVERAIVQREDFATEFMHRCVNETSFFKLLIKVIMFVEFGASPANQHTMSPFIKKLLMFRPSLAGTVQIMRDVRLVEGVDVTCMNQHLEEHVAASLLESQHPRSDDRQALSMVSRFTQQVVNLRLERCVQALPAALMIGYIAGEQPSPVVDPTGTWKRRIMRAADCKVLVELALDVMNYMHQRSKPQSTGGIGRRGNFGASVNAERMTREIMASSAVVSTGANSARLGDSQAFSHSGSVRVGGAFDEGSSSAFNLPLIGGNSIGGSTTIPPRKPITVTSFVGNLSRINRRRSTRVVQNLVEAVDAINNTHEVTYECQEHIRRRSLAPSEDIPDVPSPEPGADDDSAGDNDPQRAE